MAQPKINSWKDFGTAVRKWRAENGKSQTQLATDIGVSQPLIALVEKGEPVSPLNVQRIAKTLGVNAKALHDADAASPQSFRYCAATRCPNLRLAANEGKVFIVPLFHPARSTSYDSCPFCDLPLQHVCTECSQPILDKRAVCPNCHEMYVPVPTSLKGLNNDQVQTRCDEWDKRNRRIRQHLGFD